MINVKNTTLEYNYENYVYKYVFQKIFIKKKKKKKGNFKQK